MATLLKLPSVPLECETHTLVDCILNVMSKDEWMAVIRHAWKKVTLGQEPMLSEEFVEWVAASVIGRDCYAHPNVPQNLRREFKIYTEALERVSR